MIGHLTKRARTQQRADCVFAFESFCEEQIQRVYARLDDFEDTRRQRALDHSSLRRDLELLEVRK